MKLFKPIALMDKPDWFIFLHQAGVVLTLFLFILAMIGILCACAGLGGLAVVHYYFTPTNTR